MNYFSKALAMSRILLTYKKQKVFLPTKPIRLWIESSLVCNLSCVMCPNKDIPGHDKGIMDYQLFKNIIDEAKSFVSDIKIHHRGEPLTNSRLAEMIAYAKAARLRVRFSSNATLLDERRSAEILEAGPDLISISFDGFTKEVYEEVRRGASFEKTLDNIESFLSLKRKRKYSLPYIIIERIDLNKFSGRVDNCQIEELTRTFKRWGADEVITKLEYDWVTPVSERPQIEQPHSLCTFPWYALVICWDGTVTPCPQDYMASLKMGNVKEQSIAEIWNSQAYLDLRRDLIRQQLSTAACEKCDRLYRKQLSGLPFQYMVTYLADNFTGYGRIRRLIGSGERNE